MDNKSAYLLTIASMMAFFSTSDANAQERFPRWYVGLNGGLGFIEDAGVKATAAGTKGEIRYDTGYTLSGVIGFMPPVYKSGGGLRVEFEALRRSNDFDEMVISGVVGGLSDQLQSTSYMLNLFYDMNTKSGWMPYVGGGLGIAKVDFPTTSGFGNTDNSDNVLAWQLMAGVSYMPEFLPYTIWSMGYRFHSLGEMELSSTSGKVEVDTPATQSVEAGIKFRF